MVTWRLENYMDLLFWDEALYLNRGVNFFAHPPKTWGPSYSLWYTFLSFFISDKVHLYYFNFKLTTILICIALFLLLLSCGVQRVLAFIFSLFFLSSFINMPVWPRVSHYCVILLIAGIVVSKRQKTLAASLAVCSLALLVCAYARPELFIPFLLCAIPAYVLFLANIRSAEKSEWLLMGILTVLCVFIIYFFKTPFNSGDTGRGLRVFLQHFAWNYTEWYHLHNAFWFDFPDIIHKHFPDSSSLKGIITSNPQMFERHLLSNISNYAIQMSMIVFSFFAPIFTKDLHWLCLMVGGMLFIVYFSFTRTSKKRIRFLVFSKNNLLTFFVLSVFTLPSVIVSIYAYPRQHYLLLQVPFILLLIGLSISSIAVEITKPIQKIIVVAAIWFFVMPAAEDFRYFNLFRGEESMANLRNIRYIKDAVKTKDTVRVFDAEGFMTNLLPPNFTNYNDAYYRNMSSIVLSDFIREHHIDIIYKTPTLMMLNNVQKDTALFDLLNNPSKYGYFEQKTGNFAEELLIKKKQ
jgi:hypothetical protein